MPSLPRLLSRCGVEFPLNSLLALCLLLCMPALSSHAADSDWLINVSGGHIRGRSLPENQGAVFKGIPFAQPPVGELRWREPMPVLPWKGIREADKSGPPACQLPAGWNDAAAAESREDCLYLDVWSPHPKIKPLRPVMVWIHGGGNVGGAGGSDPLYDGPSLISHGVLLVVIEYRLGVFGFLAHPDLSRESPHHVSGNYALLDQIAALKWVRDNIAAFGGDPANVTVFGQSAGSMDLSALMTSPLASGLFHRVIGESGAAVANLPSSLADAEKTGLALASSLHVAPQDALRSLRALPVDVLLQQGRAARGITLDGWVFPSAPVEVFAAGKAVKVPMIVGTNAIEMSATGSPEELKAIVHKTFQDLAPRALALYGLEGNLASPASEVDPLYGTTGDQLGSDLFRCPSILQGEWQSVAGSPTWQYQFDRALPPKPHVVHSGELAYVFGNLRSTGSQAGVFTDADRQLSATIQGYWTNFAKTGNPNGPGLPVWPSYDVKSRQYIQFTTTAEVKVSADQRGAFRELYRDNLLRVAKRTRPASQ